MATDVTTPHFYDEPTFASPPLRRRYHDLYGNERCPSSPPFIKVLHHFATPPLSAEWRVGGEVPSLPPPHSLHVPLLRDLRPSFLFPPPSPLGKEGGGPSLLPSRAGRRDKEWRRGAAPPLHPLPPLRED